jgi:uncharacterized membrane protein YphA (DoxX/SURF4 family)
VSERDKSPRRGMCAAVLTLEAIALGLSTPVLITLSEVATGTALAIGLGLALACVLTAGMLRSAWAYHVGWAIQVAAIALGVLTPVMWVLGPIFALLWGSADLLGRKIERERSAAFAAYDRAQGGQAPDPSQPAG